MLDTIVLFIVYILISGLVLLILTRYITTIIISVLKKNINFELEKFKKISSDSIEKQIFELRRSNELTIEEIEKNKKKIMSINSVIENVFRDIHSLNLNLIAARETLNQRVKFESEINKLKSIIKRNDRKQLKEK